VIAGTIKINKVKRQLIMKQCKDLGLKTIGQINAIMSKWIKVKDIKSVLDGAFSQEEQEEEVKEEEIPIKDYDYLLSMPLWSLTEEKIEELIRQMKNKKEEHDILIQKHHFELWENDLAEFLDALDKLEAQEEKERLATGGMKNEGKKKRKVINKKPKLDDSMNAKPKADASMNAKPKADASMK
jgi:DNA topoisomerase-2